MLLSERVIVGLILVVVGLGFVIVGYNNIQPTTAEKAVAVIEELSQQKAPDVLRPKKTEGYIFMFGGGVAFVIGLRMILTSRKT